MKEFKINEYLLLRLEEGKTNIYVKGELFKQCKFLLLNIPVEKISTFDEIESIDEAIENLDHSFERKRDDYDIPPETEFWGHCSNLQVWAENEYDTRLLHRNLAFPLLKKLADAGEIIAKKTFKEEIVNRLLSNNETVITYLLELGYLDSFSTDEWEIILEDALSKDKIVLVKHLLDFAAEKLNLYYINYLLKENTQLSNFIHAVLQSKNVSEISYVFALLKKLTITEECMAKTLLKEGIMNCL